MSSIDIRVTPRRVPPPLPPEHQSAQEQPEELRPIDTRSPRGFGFVLKQTLFILMQPKASLAEIQNETSLGRPLTALAFASAIFYFVVAALLLGPLKNVGSGFQWLAGLFPEANTFTLGQLIYLYAFLLVGLLCGVVLLWMIIVIVGHGAATLAGNAGRWWTFAVSTLYILLGLQLLALPILVLSLILNMIGGVGGVLSVLLFLILTVVGLRLMGAAISVQYGMSAISALFVVLIPLMVAAAGFIIASILVPPFSSQTPAASFNANGNATANRPPLGNATPSAPPSSNEPSTPATNANNTPIETPQPGFYSANPQTIEELNKAKEAELSTIKDEGLDAVRRHDLIELKYDLKLYHSVYNAYPVSRGNEKLDGSTDILARTLRDFYGSTRDFADPQHPSYYYSYESDGAAYRLTGFHTLNQESIVFTHDD